MARYAVITTLDNVWAVKSTKLSVCLDRRADLTASGIPSALVEVLAWEDEPSPDPTPRDEPDRLPPSTRFHD